MHPCACHSERERERKCLQAERQRAREAGSMEGRGGMEGGRTEQLQSGPPASWLDC